ncbi:MAG: HupE/UreJ family protein [Pseudomonadota bacterium]
MDYLRRLATRLREYSGSAVLRLSRWSLTACLALAFSAANTYAHPEDEFCVPGEGSLDPALCEQLAALDSADGNSARTVQPILDATGAPRSASSTAVLYVGIGVGHILPGGLDHILFVLALFLTSAKARPLVIQITCFTLAHSVTLGLAAAGVISPSADIVEPLIAATIAFVAIENLLVDEMPRWRPLVVFGFGLLHGLGFAGFFGELGLPQGQFWSGLIGFNIGVEIGQLSVVLVAWLSLAAWTKINAAAVERNYRSWVARPASVLIGLIGLWWTIERVALG